MSKIEKAISNGRNAGRQFLACRTDSKREGEIAEHSTTIEKRLKTDFPEMRIGSDFLAHAEKKLEASASFAVMMVRIDDLPHPDEPCISVWPETAAAVAKVVASECRDQDGIWGEIEAGIFCCCFTEKTEAFCIEIAEKMKNHIKQVCSETISAGIAVFPTATYQIKQIFENARKALDHAAFFGPNSIACFDSVSLNISGDKFYQSGDTAKAVEEFKQALLLDPLNINVYNSLGVCYGELGELPEALKSFETAIAIDPKEVMAFYNAGLIHLLMGDKEKALDYFLKSDRINHGLFEIVFETGKLYLEQGAYKSAMPFFERAVNLRPESAHAFRCLGDCLAAENLIDEAINAYKKAVKLNPNEAAGLSALGTLFDLKNENPEIALTFCKKSVEIAPENGLFRNRLGRLYLKEGRLADALKEFEQADRLGHDSSEFIEKIQRLKAETLGN